LTAIAPRVLSAINVSLFTLYKAFSVSSLYMVLLGVLGASVFMVYFGVSQTWVAPVILSDIDKDALDLKSKILTTESTVDDLKIDVTRLRKTIGEAQTHRASLVRLRPEIDDAIAKETRQNQVSEPQLVHLDMEKQSDNSQVQEALEKLREVEGTIDEELRAGLITKTDAIQVKTSFSKSYSDLTDSKIASVLLKDNILAKARDNSAYLDTLGKRVELESEINTLEITIATAQQQMVTETKQIKDLEEALASAKRTPYWEAMQNGNVHLALVPYRNSASAVPDAAVYDCYLFLVACRQVGVLGPSYSSEEHAPHPVFRFDVRGYLVQLKLIAPESAKSTFLFIGKKPFLF